MSFRTASEPESNPTSKCNTDQTETAVRATNGLSFLNDRGKGKTIIKEPLQKRQNVHNRTLK